MLGSAAMDLARKKLGLLLSTGSERPSNIETAVGLSEAALARGADVYLYLIDDGVRALDDARVPALAGRGVKLFVCAFGCQKRRIPLRDSDTLTYCGLVVLTDIINGTDRFIALN
jgi:predicted peroxiredoxin